MIFSWPFLGQPQDFFIFFFFFVTATAALPNVISMLQKRKKLRDKIRKVDVNFLADYPATLTADLVAMPSGKWQVAATNLVPGI